MKTTTSSTLSESENSTEPVKQFFFARHGLSHFNQKATKIEGQYGRKSAEYAALMQDPSNVDSDLVEPDGILGAEATGESLKKLNFKYVWVSPLVRTMKTAIHMFKGHPNLANIRFIVEPMIRAIHTTTQNMNMDVLELM